MAKKRAPFGNPEKSERVPEPLVLPALDPTIPESAVAPASLGEPRGNGALRRDERVEMLITEMQLLQSRFDKYDDLIFRNRNWMIGLVTALVGAALTLKEARLTILAASVAAFFYLIEIIWRGGYWFTYVGRYRFIRDVLNAGEDIESIPVYDLTNRLRGKPSNRERFKEALLRAEPFVFYLASILGPLVVWWFLH